MNTQGTNAVSKSYKRKKRRRDILKIAGLLIIINIMIQQIILMPQRKQIREYAHRAIMLDETGWVLPEQYRVRDIKMPQEVAEAVKREYMEEYKRLYSKDAPYAEGDFQIVDSVVKSQVDGEVIQHLLEVEVLKTGRIKFKNNTAVLPLSVSINSDYTTINEGREERYGHVDGVERSYTVAFVKEGKLWKVYSITFTGNI